MAAADAVVNGGDRDGDEIDSRFMNDVLIEV